MADAQNTCELQLSSEMLRFSSHIDEIETAAEVLEGLHQIAFQSCKLNVLGAVLFPLLWGDWDGVEKGKTVFLHRSLPEQWWNEYVEMSRRDPSPGAMMARLAMSPFTMTETTQMLEPIGVDRWANELALKYGIRDILTCPVGGRWAVVYWSKTVLSERITPKARAILFMGATFAAIRLQKLIRSHTKRLGKGQALTPRELAVLRSLSLGRQMRETAQYLGLGEETVRSHLRKAEAKFGVNNRTHAVAQAIRQHLIP